MGNILRVLGRDIVRLLKVPPALVVVAALLVLPSVYTWYNVIGFWNPYENTQNLRVYVVNEDEGASSDLTGELHVGDMIVEELRENNQLDWAFADFDTAMSELEAGSAYATFVIPADFTENLLSLTTGDFTQPNLRYYVNEKAGPVAPKITDTGATTLDETINSTFVSTVSDVAAEAVDQALGESREALDESSSRAAEQIDEVLGVMAQARTSLSQVGVATGEAQQRAEDAKASLSEARERTQAASQGLAGVSVRIVELQGDLTTFSAAAAPAVSESLSAASEVSSQMHAAAQDATSAAREVQASVRVTIAQGEAAVEEGEALARYLREVEQGLDDGDPRKQELGAVVDELERRNADARVALEGLYQLNAGAGEMTDAIDQACDSVDASVQLSAAAVLGYADVLFGTTVPALNEGLGTLSATASSLSATVSNQQLLIDQASLVLDQLDSTLGAAREALSQTEGFLGSLEGELGGIRADVLALSQSDALAELLGEDGIDAGKIADFMGSPTEIVTDQLYDLNAYGSAMAPLFMNLTFWIGAFMLLVILKQEVDDEGIRRLTLTQRYVARFALFAIFAVLQALICCAGVLVIGVQAARVGALFLASAMASLAYLSIIYALSVTLQHIGKGICIVLVFAQIPGATGLYPIEMTPSFFQALYPFFPFTYGIGAMREAICGFYGNQYACDMAALAGYFVLFLALGIGVRPLMANVNRMVAMQVREGDIYNGEDVEIPVRPYRFSQILRALSDKDVYRDEVYRRYERFTRWHPRLIRGSLVAGIVVPVALGVVFALTPTEKVTLLTACLAWLVVVFVFLVVVESLRFSFERQMQLEGMSSEDLRSLYSSRNSMQRSGAFSTRAEGAREREEASAGADADAREGARADADAEADVREGEDVRAEVPTQARVGARADADALSHEEAFAGDLAHADANGFACAVDAPAEAAGGSAAAGGEALDSEDGLSEAGGDVRGGDRRG